MHDEKRARDEASARTAARAAEAVWLGASLEDLASVTGHSRQAARKRWPGLGAIERRRRWLSHHLAEIAWAMRLLRDNAELVRADRDRIAAGERLLTTEFAAQAHDAEHPVRWHRLERFVDVDLRAVVRDADPTDPSAQFAVHGAGDLLGYYDHATRDVRPGR